MREDTGDEAYFGALWENREFFYEYAAEIGWIGARIAEKLGAEFREQLRGGLRPESGKIKEECEKNPYGVPYRPMIYGAGWSIQGMAFRYYFLHQAYPELLDYPFLWQQAEYVLGGGSSNYLFLVLAVIKAQTEEQGRNS